MFLIATAVPVSAAPTSVAAVVNHPVAFGASQPLTAQDSSPKPTLNHAVAFGVSAPLQDLAKLPQPTQYELHGANLVRRIPKPNMNQGPSVDPVEESIEGPASNYKIGLNFLGISPGFANFTVSKVPPDTNIAVGDTQIVQWVNLSYAIFRKSDGAALTGAIDDSGCGPLLLQQLGPQFTIGATVTCTDPQGQALTTTIDWGDGSKTTVNGGSLTAYPHIYQAANFYRLMVTATDTSGLQGTALAYLNLLMLQPVSVFAGQSGDTTGMVSSTIPVLVQFTCTSVTDSSGNIRQASELGISCQSNPLEIMLTGGAQNVTIGIQTTGAGTGSLVPSAKHRTWLYALWLAPWALTFLSAGFGAARSRRRGWSQYSALAAIVVLFLLFTYCGGGFTPPRRAPPTTATPPGNYQVTVIDQPVGSTTGLVQTTLIVPLTVAQAQ